MKDPIAKKMKPDIAKNYKFLIQEPLHNHRDEMASKFEHRVDYVDISAFQVGKVKVDTTQQAAGGAVGVKNLASNKASEKNTIAMENIEENAVRSGHN